MALRKSVYLAEHFYTWNHRCCGEAFVNDCTRKRLRCVWQWPLHRGFNSRCMLGRSHESAAA